VTLGGDSFSPNNAEITEPRRKSLAVLQGFDLQLWRQIGIGALNDIR
jgi:hypothetical protein